ncbi:HEAT repeat domain-containing protein [Methanovulcanius yangii]|uniref:HEAT repeat domain-containing protein n=1 Tax=Methanovulcanius yangii TaxID=1789227 RepID=UPI0029CA3AD5|nr:HEAT repeat domain-containing protein [Methanovulcanius yangii]
MAFFGLGDPPDVYRLKEKQNVKGLIKALGYHDKKHEDYLQKYGHSERDFPSRDIEIRSDAAKALGNIRDTRAVEPLIHALNDENYKVRKSAAEALGRIGDGRAVEPLCKALNDEYDVRITSAEALRMIGQTFPGKIGDPQTVVPLINLLNAIEPEIRQIAIHSLGETHDSRAVEPLIAALNEEDPELRSSAINALSWIGDIKALDPIIAMLDDRNDKVREDAASALEYFGDCKAAGPLVAALSDEHEDVRRKAAWSLRKIGDDRAVEPLITVLGDWDGRVRVAAVSALGEIGDPRAVEPLIAAFSDWLDYMPDNVAKALEKIGHDQNGTPITRAMIDEWKREHELSPEQQNHMKTREKERQKQINREREPKKQIEAAMERKNNPRKALLEYDRSSDFIDKNQFRYRSPVNSLRIKNGSDYQASAVITAFNTKNVMYKKPIYVGEDIYIGAINDGSYSLYYAFFDEKEVIARKMFKEPLTFITKHSRKHYFTGTEYETETCSYSITLQLASDSKMGIIDVSDEAFPV